MFCRLGRGPNFYYCRSALGQFLFVLGPPALLNGPGRLFADGLLQLGVLSFIALILAPYFGLNIN